MRRVLSLLLLTAVGHVSACSGADGLSGSGDGKDENAANKGTTKSVTGSDDEDLSPPNQPEWALLTAISCTARVAVDDGREKTSCEVTKLPTDADERATLTTKWSVTGAEDEEAAKVADQGLGKVDVTMLATLFSKRKIAVEILRKGKLVRKLSKDLPADSLGGISNDAVATGTAGASGPTGVLNGVFIIDFVVSPEADCTPRNAGAASMMVGTIADCFAGSCSQTITLCADYIGGIDLAKVAAGGLPQKFYTGFGLTAPGVACQSQEVQVHQFSCAGVAGCMESNTVSFCATEHQAKELQPKNPGMTIVDKLSMTAIGQGAAAPDCGAENVAYNFSDCTPAGCNGSRALCIHSRALE